MSGCGKAPPGPIPLARSTPGVWGLAPTAPHQPQARQRGPAAIDADRGPGHLIRRRRTQIQRGATQLLDRGELSGRLPRQHHLAPRRVAIHTARGHLIGDLRLDQRRQHITRAARAIPSPMPEFDPVMTAVFPASDMRVSFPGGSCYCAAACDAAPAKETAKSRPTAGAAAEKKRPRKAGVKLLRQVSYRQETYRAVTLL